jgi:cyclomaltodextrinase
MTEFTTPEWVKDAIFYQIFPDRFAKSEAVPEPSNLEPWDSPPTVHGFKGGDLLGVAEHLDYLQALGITAIYFNPIFQSAANHRYFTHDYYQIDPILGGNHAFRRLLDEAHRRGIRVILDGVFNHVGRGFFQFNHILENGPSSPYVDWFHVKGFPLNAYSGQPNYQCWADEPALPEFNTDNPQVRQSIFEVVCYWTEQGIDGWRVDVPFCIDDDAFWQESRRIVKAINSEAYIVGEVWQEATRWLRGDQFDAVMNYLFTKPCIGFFVGDRLDGELVAGMGYAPIPTLDAQAFARHIEELLALYPWEVTLAQLNLLDSHDTARFLTLAGGDVSALKLAVLFQMTYPGAPCIYYGDEVGLEGGRDPDCRRAMPWDETQWNTDLLAYYRRLIALRKAHPALRRGEYVCLHAHKDVYAFLRRLEDEMLVIVLNNGKGAYPLDVPLRDHLPEGVILHDLLSAREAGVTSGRLQGLSLSPQTGMILRASRW